MITLCCFVGSVAVYRKMNCIVPFDKLFVRNERPHTLQSKKHMLVKVSIRNFRTITFLVIRLNFLLNYFHFQLVFFLLFLFQRSSSPFPWLSSSIDAEVLGMTFNLGLLKVHNSGRVVWSGSQIKYGVWLIFQYCFLLN